MITAAMLVQSLAPTTKCFADTNKIVPFLTAVMGHWNISSCIIPKIRIDLNPTTHELTSAMMAPGLLEHIRDCQSTWTIVPVGMFGWKQNFGHTNILLFHQEKKEMERFEPYGHQVPFYRSVLIDDYCRDVLGPLFGYTYVAPMNYCLKGPQFQEHPDKKLEITCPGVFGYCVAWAVMYTVLRLLNPEMQREAVVSDMISERTSEQLHILVRQFVTFIDSVIPDEPEYK